MLTSQTQVNDVHMIYMILNLSQLPMCVYALTV